MGSPVDEEHDQHRDFGKCWLSTEKKKAKHERCELFYLGQNEDYSLGESISDFSEKLLEVVGGSSVYM